MRSLPEDDSVFGRVADWLLENPLRSGAILVVGLTTVAIVANAVFFQSGRHPAPLFATRPPSVPETPVAVAAAVPLPKSRDDAVEPELVRSERFVLPGNDPIGAAVDSANVLAVQEALAARGMYDGKVDGKLGTKTKTAIAAYERKYGLPETGEPSAELLAHLRRTAALRIEPAAAPAPQDKQLMDVQAALNAIGYGPIRVTGRMSPETADSIRRFELENGMPITGEAGAAIVRKLVAIGAMQPAD